MKFFKIGKYIINVEKICFIELEEYYSKYTSTIYFSNGSKIILTYDSYDECINDMRNITSIK